MTNAAIPSTTRRIARQGGVMLLFALAAWLLLAMFGGGRAWATVCAPHYKPKGCTQPPASVKKAPSAKKQPLRKEPIEAAVGSGGGPRELDQQKAVAWAVSQEKSIPAIRTYNGYCEWFVEAAYNTSGMFADAQSAAAALKPALHAGSPASAPLGTLMYFKADRSNYNRGHVGISLGHGRMISALSKITEDKVDSAYWKSLYLGWAYAPANWTGRSNAAEGQTGTLVSITGPSNVGSISGQVTVGIRAAGAAAVQVAGYYADDPRVPSTRAWHLIGNAVQVDGGWEMPLDTTRIPSQGAADLGTVLIKATALDSSGNTTPDSDSRRYIVDNGVIVAPPPTVTPGPGRETTGGVANTWTSYQEASGTQGLSIGSGATVDVDCRVEGFKVSDGNTWWYRIRNAPWNGDYYASADAFYNNGSTSGSLQGTPWYDSAIQLC